MAEQIEQQARTPTPRERSQQAFDACLRVEAVVDLASMVATDAFEGSLDGAVEDLFDDLIDDNSRLHPSVECLRESASDVIDNKDGSLLYQQGLLGLAVRFATPVMHSTGDSTWTFSWGYYTSIWVYADSYDAAWQLGLAWAEKEKKAAKPTRKKRAKKVVAA